jgi:hypothetical protein
MGLPGENPWPLPWSGGDSEGGWRWSGDYGSRGGLFADPCLMHRRASESSWTSWPRGCDAAGAPWWCPWGWCGNSQRFPGRGLPAGGPARTGYGILRDYQRGTPGSSGGEGTASRPALLSLFARFLTHTICASTRQEAGLGPERPGLAELGAAQALLDVFGISRTETVWFPTRNSAASGDLEGSRIPSRGTVLDPLLPRGLPAPWAPGSPDGG